MKKTIFLLLAACMLCTGCAKETQYELANYQGELKDGETKSDYNKELFYRNDKKTAGADPFVMDNTQVDGYYYMYVTDGLIYCYRSENLMDWEPMGNTLDIMDYTSTGGVTEARQAVRTDIWAAEAIYDPETELYYLFFSASPVADKDVKPNDRVEAGQAKQIMYVATSRYAYKDFRLVDFTDASSCGAENLHKIDKSVYPHYYAKYLYFNPADIATFAEVDKLYGEHGGYIPGIDPHPYVDEDGKKYLFWADWEGMNRICVVEMENWLKPIWSTAKAVIWANYYTEEDYQAAKTNPSVATATYEMTEKGCNEGPEVVKHNGKYYMTFSINYWENSSYQVIQAVSDNLMGPYRKLTEEEGGILISGGTSGSQEVSGTGHHSFVTVGEQLYIVYHRHDDVVKAGGDRNHAIDEIEWVKIKDKDGNDLDVMYTNGPTCTVQPKIAAFSEYRNIAGEAKVTGSEEASYLTDGLLSIYKYANETFIGNIKETNINKKTTFTFDFDSERTVRAIMIYNSKMENTAFKNVARIELVGEKNSEEVIRFIKDLKFSSEYFKANDYDGSMYYITPGSAAYAEFDELNVKQIRITVDVPEGQETVGISEVRILGK